MKHQSIRFESHAVTHEGRVRQLNEDRYFASPRIGVWVVADGMGGHDAGEIASATIIAQFETLGVATSAPDLRARVEDRIERANAEIWNISQKRGGGTIGSTLVALLTFERQFACVWLGDSRVYLCRDGVLTQVSRDHTEVQELVDRGVITPREALTWPRRNVITRAVGVHETAEPEIRMGALEAGDMFVLNSDGLTGHVSDDEILEAVVGGDPQAACRTLLDLVLERGATDNVTIVVVRCCEEDAHHEADRTLVNGLGLDVKHGG